jgi:hypothetical protein
MTLRHVVIYEFRAAPVRLRYPIVDLSLYGFFESRDVRQGVINVFERKGAFPLEIEVPLPPFECAFF